MAMTLVSTVTVGSGGAASIEFTNIPQTGKDICLLLSNRVAVNNTYASTYLRFNNDTTASAYTIKWLQGSGTTTAVQTNTADYALVTSQGTATTANSFDNQNIYVSNYGGTVAKSFSLDSVTASISSEAWQTIQIGRWTGTAPISSVQLTNASNSNFLQNTTASLYIIS